MTTRPLLALFATLAVQALGSLTLAVPSVLAPAVAPALGLGADRVGVFIGVAYFVAMLSGLASAGWIARIGAVGVSQAALLAFALGTGAAASGWVPALLVAAALFGVGYGLINPASTSLLGRHAPSARRGLFFSLKQAGVPVGIAIAGVTMPWGLHAFGWRPATLAAGVSCALLALALRPATARLEPQRVTRDAPREASPGFVTLLRNRRVMRLSLMSFSLAFTQLCYVTFLVSHLNLTLGRSLALAAGLLAAGQGVSIVARILWGHAADRWIEPGVLLGLLGLGAGASCVGLGLLDASSHPGWALLAAAACAATAMGWNGVFFAELTRNATPQEAAAMAGTSQFFTFSGGVAGPLVFAEFVRQGGSYGSAFMALGVLPAAASLLMLRAASDRR